MLQSTSVPGGEARSGLIAVVGDTHLPRGSRVLPEHIVEVLRAAELILHTGDFTAASVLDELLELGPVQAVHGNVDDAELRARLPERLVVEHGDLTIGLVHDAGPQTGRPDRLRRAFPECGLVVYGHTHRPEVTRHDDLWIVNPGSPTERRRSPRHTMAVIEDGVPRLLDV